MIRLNAAVRRQRRRLRLVLAVLALAGVVLLAHSPVGEQHMSMGEESAMTAAMTICLAVVETAAVAVAAVALGLAFRIPLLGVLVVPLPPMAPPRPTTTRTRAGPAFLQVFLR